MSSYFSQRINKQVLQVALLGVDGSGKSTVINELKTSLKKHLNGQVITLDRYNSRSQHQAEIDHHGMPDRSKIGSLVKLFYKVIRWNSKYHWRVTRNRSQVKLVLFDHFYFYSLLFDPRRFRFSASTKWVWSLLFFVPKPHYIILLDVPSDVAFSRKQELSLDALNELIETHRQFVKQHPNGHIIDSTQPLDEVVSEIEQFVLQLSAKM